MVRTLVIVIGALIATLFIANFWAATASTCSDACDKTYQSCSKSCKQNDTDCFTKCINERGACLTKCG